MKRYIQHEPFNIYQFKTSHWEHPVHKHSYFEIIFIRDGAGKHFLNGNTFEYAAGDVFLLGPEDYHSFEIKQETNFCYIRFTEVFIKDTSVQKSVNWLRTIEFLLNTAYEASGSIVTDNKEKELLEHLLTVLLYEYTNREEGSYEIIMNGLMKAILGILARNMVRLNLSQKKENKGSQLIEEIMLFISQHIHQPKDLRIENLVQHFHYSPSYLSIFFKKQTGESLQQYILKYKLRMIENRLQFSDYTISQITHEFGFTDESHLNKIFKKYYGELPSGFRQKKSNNIPSESVLTEIKDGLV